MDMFSDVDICCGGGAIELYLLKQLPFAKCIAIDTRPTACQLSTENAKRLGVIDRTNVLQTYVLQESVFDDLTRNIGKVDFVVCNPPYCPSGLLDTKPERYFR